MGWTVRSSITGPPAVIVTTAERKLVPPASTTMTLRSRGSSPSKVR